MFIDPEMWSPLGKAIGRAKEAKNINDALDKIKIALDNQYKTILEKDGYVTPDKLRNTYLGKEIRNNTVLSLYDIKVEQKRNLVGKTIRDTTLSKYLATRKRVGDFMAYKYKKEDMPIRDVNFQFVTDYEVYLKSVCKCGHNSTVKHLRYLKQIITNALKNRYITVDPFDDYIAGWFSGLLGWSLSHKLITLVVTLVLLVGSVSLIAFGFIGNDLAPQGDQGQFVIKMELPRDVSIEETNQAAYKAENALRSSPLVETVFTTVGAEENGQPQARLADLRVKMIPHNKRNISTSDFSREAKHFLQQHIPGVQIWVAMTDLMGNIDEAPIQYYITGHPIDSVRVAANLVFDNIKSVKGIVDPKLSAEESSPEISIIPDRDKMSAMGVPFEVLGMTLNNAFSGNNDAKFRQAEYEYDINIRLDNFDRRSMADIENLTLINTSGEAVKLKQFARIEETDAPGILERRNRSTCITLNSQVGGRPTGDIGQDVSQIINALDLPKNITFIPGGELEMQDESFGTMGTYIL
jgi:multidrug efflux pump subunit AcrB